MPEYFSIWKKIYKFMSDSSMIRLIILNVLKQKYKKNRTYLFYVTIKSTVQRFDVNI